MTKKLTDEEAMEMAYKRLFGDLDGIESKSIFGDEDEPKGAPATENAGGVKITVEPLMAACAEPKEEETEEEDEDKLKGIGDMSPLMAQLHGKR